MTMKDNSTGKAYSVSNLDGSFCGLEASVDSQVVVSDFDEGWINQLQVFNLLSETIFIHDISGNLLFLNQNGIQNFEIEEVNLSKLTISNLSLDFTNYEQFSSLWPAVLLGQQEQVEFPFFNSKNNLEYYLKITMSPYFLNGQQVVFAVIEGFNKPVSLIPDNETLIPILENREVKFLNLFEQISDAVFIGNKAGRIFEVNQGFCNLLGYSKEESLRLNMADFLINIDQSTLHFLFDEIGLDKTNTTEKELIRNDSSVFSAELNFKVLPDGNIQVIVRDVSIRKQLELELIQAKENAEIHDQLKTAFLRNMNHEIRTPLNAIVGFADLMSEYYDDQEKLVKFTNIIKEKGSDLIDIIDDILDFSNIESGQISVNMKEYNLNSLFLGIENYFLDYQRHTDKTHIDFQIHVSSEIKSLDVITDHEKLRQVIVNLVSNAFKFTSSGSIVLGCEMNEPGLLTFYVSDTGIGIPKEIQNEIFSRFTKISRDSSRIYGGTGIGLSIVQGILNLLGGQIWIESEECNGSTFYFNLPFDRVIKPEIAAIPDVFAQKLDQSEFKVLFVEENYYNTEYIQEIFSDSGIPFQHTKFGKKAIEICSSQIVPVVLINVRLADMTGFEAAMKIKELSPETLIIAQTTYATNEEMERAIQAGCIEYLSSPVKPDLLISKMTAYLQKSTNSYQN